MPILLEHRSGYRLGHEESLVAAELRNQGRAFEMAALSQLQRGKVDTSHASLVVGSVDFVKGALRRRGIELQPVDSYPPALAGLLYRQIWMSELCHVLDLIEHDARPLFVKPAVNTKRFTGLVVRSGADWRLNGVSRRLQVWCADPVEWLSEWRVYVVRGVVRYVAHYDGDPALVLSHDRVEEAVKTMSTVPGSPRSYAIDFGVLASGQTALVEVNDGLAIGAYGDLDGSAYLELLQDRWDQLTGR